MYNKRKYFIYFCIFNFCYISCYIHQQICFEKRDDNNSRFSIRL